MDAKQTARQRGVDSARILQVIETKALRGSGSIDDPYEICTQYWSLDGAPIAEAVKVSDLSKVLTCDLVAELQAREGVEKTVIEPYQDLQIEANGPAIVLVIID